MHQLQGDLAFLKEDIAYVERQRLELSKSKERYSMKIRMLIDSSSPQLDRLASDNSSTGGAISLLRSGQGGATVPSSGHTRRGDSKQRVVSMSSLKKEASVDSGNGNTSDSLGVTAAHTGVMMAKKRRVAQQVKLNSYLLRYFQHS